MPKLLEGSPIHDDYKRVAPRPQDFVKLVERVKDLDAHAPAYAPAQIKAIPAPVLLIAADNDIISPEHFVELFRLLGGGVEGTKGLPKSRLAVLPGTSHLNVIDQKQLLLPIVRDFLQHAGGK